MTEELRDELHGRRSTRFRAVFEKHLYLAK
jgi:hypothetical protein